MRVVEAAEAGGAGTAGQLPSRPGCETARAQPAPAHPEWLLFDVTA